MAASTQSLTDLDSRIQLAEGMAEDRRALIADLDKEGHDTTIVRDMLAELEQSLAELKAARGRLASDVD